MRLSLKNFSEKGVISVFLILLFLNDFIGVSIPSIVFTGLWLILIISAGRNIAAAFTLSSVICFSSTLSITIPMAVYVAISLLRRKLKFKVNLIFIISVLCVIVELSHIVMSPIDEFKPFVNTSLAILLVSVIITEIYNKTIEPGAILKYYLVMYAFLSLDIVVATCRQMGSFAAIISSKFRIGQIDTESGEVVAGVLGMNANGLALLSVIAVSVAALLLIKKQLRPSVSWFMIAFSSLIGFLTVSKTFLLVLMAFVALILISNAVRNKRKLYEPFGLLALLSIIAYWITQQKFFENVLNRFSEENLTTGRVEIAMEYIEKMSNNIFNVLFGVGIQNIHTKLNMVHSVHTATVEIYVCMGLLGLALYLVFFVSLCNMGARFLKANKASKNKLDNFIPFIVYFIFIQSLQFFRINYIYTLLAVCFACMTLLSPNEKQIQEGLL